MATLKAKAQSILDEKVEKIIPENIKAGIKVFDVTGTYEGGLSPEISMHYEQQEIVFYGGVLANILDTKLDNAEKSRRVCDGMCGYSLPCIKLCDAVGSLNATSPSKDMTSGYLGIAIKCGDGVTSLVYYDRDLGVCDLFNIDENSSLSIYNLDMTMADLITILSRANTVVGQLNGSSFFIHNDFSRIGYRLITPNTTLVEVNTIPVNQTYMEVRDI